MRVRIEREHSPEYVAVFSISMSVWPVQRYTVYMNWNGLIAAYTTRFVGRGPVQTCPPLQQQAQRSGHNLSQHQLFWPAQSFTGTTTDLWFPPLYIVSAASKVANTRPSLRNIKLREHIIIINIYHSDRQSRKCTKTNSCIISTLVYVGENCWLEPSNGSMLERITNWGSVQIVDKLFSNW